MNEPEQARPGRVVAIVGRPNVGKSALFNRLVGRRLAIVHEESGVTRDRLVAEAQWGAERFDVIDTGGLALMDAARSADQIEAGIRRQVEAALQDAAAVVLVVDATAGLTPMDVEMGRLLHASGRPVFVAANKADNEARDAAAAEFEALGFPAFPVSALHDRGVGALMDEVAERLPPPAPPESVQPLRLAVVGRPNAGKSSYINRLLRGERVLVSDAPGTTRDSVEIPFRVGHGAQARHYLLVDTAGLRKAGHSHGAVERYSVLRAEESVRRADVVALVLDASEGPSAQDKRIAALVLEESKGCLLLVNKWDLALAAKVTQRRYEQALRAAVPFLDFVPAVFLSALTGYNVRRSIEAVDFVAAAVQTRLTTGTLNRVLRDAFTRTQPPAAGGRRLKFYYAAQTGAAPVRIRLFVSDPRRLPAAYKQYLIHSLRAAFGLEGAPVVLQIRSHHEDDRSG